MGSEIVGPSRNSNGCAAGVIGLTFAAWRMRANVSYCGSPGYPQDPEEVRQRVLSDFRRAYFPQGVQRQMAAAMATPDRRPKLATIKAPTMVIHGADDALANVAGGRDTVSNVPGAELLVVEGMGHNLPLPLVDTIVGGIMSAVGRARASASSP